MPSGLGWHRLSGSTSSCCSRWRDPRRRSRRSIVGPRVVGPQVVEESAVDGGKNPQLFIARGRYGGVGHALGDVVVPHFLPPRVARATAGDHGARRGGASAPPSAPHRYSVVTYMG